MSGHFSMRESSIFRIRIATLLLHIPLLPDTLVNSSTQVLANHLFNAGSNYVIKN